MRARFRERGAWGSPPVDPPPVDPSPALRWLLAGVGVVMLGVVFGAQPAWAGTVTCPTGPVSTPSVTWVHTLVTMFETTIRSFIVNARPIARDLLLLLVAVELVSSAATWGLSRTGIDEFVTRLAFKVLVWGLILAVIDGTGDPSSVFNLEHVTNGFRALAQTVSGSSLPTPYPDALVERAFEHTACMLVVANSSGFLLFGFTQLWTFFTASAVVIGFMLVAVRLWVAILNTIIATATGLVLLGFAGWRGTAGIADSCFTWVFSAAIKLFFLDLLIYASDAVIPVVWTLLPGSTTLLGSLSAPLVAWSFATLAVYIPAVAGRLFAKNVNIGIARSISR